MAIYTMYSIDSAMLNAKQHDEDSNILGWHEIYQSSNLDFLKKKCRDARHSWLYKIIDENNNFITNSLIEKRGKEKEV